MGLFLKGIRLPGKLPTFDAVEAPLPKRVILPLRQYIGGPAGLTSAYYLARFGHSPTVFEAMPKFRGMLRYGIPTYRLPKEVLDWEIEGILDLGVAVKTGVRMGADFTLETLTDDGFDAVFLATGAWGLRGRSLKESSPAPSSWLRCPPMPLRSRRRSVRGWGSAAGILSRWSAR